ncbi:hypothetical protein QJS66_19635 [Kocuria rhizophila]|nr:hypothetical protein QJS66_19635 [Kocuria rhizophila]
MTDVDLGVVVPDPDNAYGPGNRPEAAQGPRREGDPDGPQGGRRRPRRQVEGRKRSILVRF